MRWRLAPRAAFPITLLALAGLTASATLYPPRTTSPRDDRAAAPRALSCARVGSDAWSPLPGLEYTGALLADLPAAPHATLSLIVGDAVALDTEMRTASGAFPYRQERLRRGPGVGVPPDLWLEGGDPWDLPLELRRITVDARADRAESIEIALGRRAPRVLARLSGYDAATKTRVCAATRFASRAARTAIDIAPAAADHFASGWYAEERRPDGAAVRWMREHGAVLVPWTGVADVVVRVRAAPPETPGRNDAPLLSLRVNDIYDAPTVPMASDGGDYEWEIPRGAWVDGVNELFFSVSRTPPPAETGGRTRGLALERLVVSTAAVATAR